jgi:antibiotic biosynthesis monooxygenase (ABM) superfamily enzyme
MTIKGLLKAYIIGWLVGLIFVLAAFCIDLAMNRTRNPYFYGLATLVVFNSMVAVSILIYAVVAETRRR